MFRSEKRVDPAKRVTPQVYKKTLSAVNKLRKRGGLKPLAKMPTGVPGEGSSCPIFFALAPLGVKSVSGSEVEIELTNKLSPDSTQTEEVYSGDLVQGGDVFEEFVDQFDNDELGAQKEEW